MSGGTGPATRPVIDPAELRAVRALHGRGLRRLVRIDLDRHRFGTQDSHKLFGDAADRRGEVALVVERPDGGVLLHTKAFYPEGAFRVPTGGIHPDEAVLAAVAREGEEETGLALHVAAFLGLVRYQIARDGATLAFASWVFHLRAPDAEPQALDASEEITAFRWVAVDELPAVARALRRLPPAWAAWGAFRASVHDLAWRALSAGPGAPPRRRAVPRDTPA